MGLQAEKLTFRSKWAEESAGDPSLNLSNMSSIPGSGRGRGFAGAENSGKSISSSSEGGVEGNGTRQASSVRRAADLSSSCVISKARPEKADGLGLNSLNATIRSSLWRGVGSKNAGRKFRIAGAGVERGVEETTGVGSVALELALKCFSTAASKRSILFLRLKARGALERSDLGVDGKGGRANEEEEEVKALEAAAEAEIVI